MKYAHDISRVFIDNFPRFDRSLCACTLPRLRLDYPSISNTVGRYIVVVGFVCILVGAFGARYHNKG